MRPNVVLAASARLAASLVCLGAAPALAGDAALAEFLGFSADGRSFAFEEYGVQDGSGFAYSNVYLIDLPTDSWAGGSPFRASADGETADRPLAEVRAEAKAKAAPALAAAAIDTPAETLWLEGISDGDGKLVAFSYGPVLSEGNYLSLELATMPVTSSLDCAGLTEGPPLGFALRFARDEGEGTLVHDDAGTIPASRGCVTDYRLYAVVRPFQSLEPFVAIVASYPYGFEGPDRRFLAVPLQ